jgi:hypothetical protein
LLKSIAFSIVVADEMPLGRRHRMVEQMGWRLGVDRSVVQDDQSVLAWDREILEALGQRRRDQPRGHVAVERDAGTENGTHGGQARSLEEAASAWPRQPPEHQSVGALGIIRIQFAQTTLFPAHHDPPPRCVSRRARGTCAIRPFHTPRNARALTALCGLAT